jgi:predicted transposase
MKTTIKIQLEADEVGKKRLLDTMESFNKACNEIAETCFEQKSDSKFKIQKNWSIIIFVRNTACQHSWPYEP